VGIRVGEWDFCRPSMRVTPIVCVGKFDMGLDMGLDFVTYVTYVT
jgi:hypothetical protein